MMGREYFTVAGYITDGEIVCRACGDKAGLLVEDQITEAQADNFVSDGEGLYCGDCGAEIVAPPEPEEDHTLTHDFGDCTHAEDCDPDICIYCDMTREEAAKTICPEYDPDEGDEIEEG